MSAGDEEFGRRRRGLGVADELAELEGLTPSMLVALGEAGIKELDDFAELAVDELTDPAEGLLRSYDLGEDEASAMIMAARAHWFEDEEPAEAETAGEDASEVASEDEQEAAT